MVQTIHLTRGKTTLVDDQDYARFIATRCKAQAHKVSDNRYYASFAPRPGCFIYLHRWILDAPRNKIVDHINGDGLDNLRGNLRLTTSTGNSLNRTAATQASTGYRGVRKNDSICDTWLAYVNVDNKQTQLGSFKSPEAAAVVREHYIGQHYPTATRLPTPLPMSLSEAEKYRTTVPTSKSGHPNIKRVPAPRAGGFVYEAYVRIDGKRQYLGRFPSIDEALAAQDLAKTSAAS